MLPHEKLDAYWFLEEYAAFIDYILPRIKRVSMADFEQLDRQRGSMLYNTIEACADISPGDKARYFRYSRREVQESFGVFWEHHRKGTITETELRIARYYVERSSAMLWFLMRRWAK